MAHVNNTMAHERCAARRLRLRQMFLDAARYQVDFMGGDANAAIYRYFKRQPIMNIAKSSFSIMLNTMVHSINQVIQNPEQKVHAGLVTSNSWEFFERYSSIVNNHTSEEAHRLLNAEDLSIDCVVGVVLSWGHSNPLMRWREEKGANIVNRLADPTFGYPDFFVQVAEYPLLLQRKHLWLSTRGRGDESWHSPLFIRLRTMEDRSKRKRSTEGYDRRLQRDEDRWRQRRDDEHGRGSAPSSSSRAAPQTWTRRWDNWEWGTWSSWYDRR